jgi:hypothetical protein
MSTEINLAKRIAIKEEGTAITSNVNSINFAGSGVTATTVGNDVTVTVSSGGGTVKKVALQTTYGTAITSTTAELASSSILIPANTIPANCILDLSWMMERTLSSSNTTFTRCYINTSDTLTGASLLATGQITTTLLTGRHIRQIAVNGSTWRIANTVQIITSDLSYGTTVLSTVTMATNQDIYLIFSVQNGNTSTTSQITFSSLLSYE